ncbi:hypothetical protein GQ457_17G012930 [Hibiscus cannabinus]
MERYPHFHDLMTPSGSWDVALLLSLFPAPVAHRILSIRCPNTSDGVDFCHWRWHDRFTVREAYMKCMENSLDSSSTHWDVVWSLSVSQRVRVFLWLALRQKLMTNLERQRRNLCNYVSCSRCSFAESTIHVLRDCAHAKQIWDAVCSATAVPQRLPSPLHDASPCQWSPPPSPWICLNTDGGVCKSTNIAIAGGLFRDNCGTWIRGFELLQVQSDCAKAISTLTASTVRIDSHALIRSIHSLCQRGWEVDFVWIPREANQVADQLVKDLHQSQYERVCIDVPPAHMSDLLTRDINGSPYSRGSA